MCERRLQPPAWHAWGLVLWLLHRYSRFNCIIQGVLRVLPLATASDLPGYVSLHCHMRLFAQIPSRGFLVRQCWLSSPCTPSARFFSSPKVRSSVLHGLPFICMEFLYWTYRSMFISIWTSSADVSSSLKVSCHKLRTVSFWYGTIRHLRQLDFFNVQTLRRRSSRAKNAFICLNFSNLDISLLRSLF